MIRVKICGLMRKEDVGACAAAGVHALGFVVNYPRPVPWNLTPEEAGKLMAVVSPFISRCVVTGGDVGKVLDLAGRLRPDVLQLHGDETLEETITIAAELKKQGIRCVRALRAGKDGRLRFSVPDPREAARRLSETEVAALLVDSYTPQMPGGTGIVLDMGVFDAVRSASALPVIAGGGLRADNLREVLGARRPYAVDVLSGVEKSRGVKDPEKIRALMAAAMAL